MLVVPDAAAPRSPGGIVAVQLMLAPDVGLESATAEVVTPEHMLWFGNENWTVGLGLTVMTYAPDGPPQPFNVS